jgi:hypothetical protein
MKNVLLSNMKALLPFCFRCEYDEITNMTTELLQTMSLGFNETIGMA